MSITSVVNDTVTSESVINALKPLPPTISGYSVGGLDDTALDPAGGQTVQINGTGFLAGATITFDGSAVAVVTYVNPNRLTFTSPAKSAGTYTIYAVNPDGGTAIFIPGIIYSVLPTWTTSAGSLGSYYETTSISNTVVASGDAPITYSLFSGSLPTGATLYANGVITGTAPVDSSSTTYSFTIQASDAQLQDSTRSFSLTINVDAVTWVSPANNTTYTSAVDSAIANVALSATDAAGYAVSYSANALPTGLSLTGSNIAGTPTVIADSSTLLTATAATTNRTAVRTINWSITVANDPYFEYNTLLIPGASTTFVDDASTNNFAVTINGDTKPNNFNPYTPGYYSNYFDGNGDYLTTQNNAAFNLASNNFTIEAFFYTGSTSDQVIISAWNTTSFEIIYFSGILYCQTNSSAPRLTTSTWPLNQWNHIAFVRSGNTYSAYLNGTRFATATDSQSVPNINAAPTIGVRQGGTSFPFFGYLSNLRVVNGTAVYDPTLTTLTVPTTPLTAIANTSLLTCQSNRFLDNSTNNFTLTVFGNTLISSFDPFVPNSSYSTYGSGYFGGSTSNRIIAPANAAFAFGTSAFTVEAWIYVTNLSAENFIFDTRSSVSTSGVGFSIEPNTGKLRYSGNANNVLTSTGITANAWFHVAWAYNGTTLTGYINGVSGGTATPSFNITQNNGEIGNVPFSGVPTTAYITDVRVVKGTAVYTSNFTPPSAPLTAIANTSLLVLQNNQSVNNSVFLDNSTNNFLVTRNGNTTQGTFSPYGGNWSNYFTGSSYLNLPSSSALSLGTGDFCIEGWLNVSSASTVNTFIQTNWAGAGAGSSFAIWHNVSGYANKIYVASWSYNSGAPLMVSTTQLTIGQWYHIAVTRSGTSWKLFINGVSEATASGSYNIGTQLLYIGCYDAGYFFFQGYISNTRVVKGSAVYTSNFTPSTTPLTPITNTQLLTCADSRFIDDSINNFAITPSGTPSIQRFSPFNPSIVTPTSYSGYFDGTGDYLTLPVNSNLAMGTGNFTIEFWLYTTNISQTGYILQTDISSTSLYVSLSGSTVRLTDQNTVFATTSTLLNNTWYYIAVVRSGTSSVIYTNGVAGTAVTCNINFSQNGPTIGANSFIGYISNIRIVKGTAVYTSNFTPPTSPLTAIANTQLLTCQSPTFIDNSTNNFTITAFGNSQPTQQNPFGFTSATTNGYTVSTIGGSGYFDDTGDYLTLASNTATAVQSNNFTMEFYVYLTNGSANSNQCFYSNYTTFTNAGSIYFGKHTNNSGFVTVWFSTYSTSGPLLAESTLPPNNQWTHYALVRSGNTFSLYRNGALSTSSTAFTGAATTSSNANWIFTNGDTLSLTPAGYLTDFRIVKGTAIYTSNFVPPSAPLTAVQNTVLLNNMTSAGVYDAAMMTTMETVGDAKLSTAVSKFGGSSMSFDGTGDYAVQPTNINFGYGTGDFTIEFWLYMNSISADQTIFSNLTSDTSVNPHIYYASGGGIRYFTGSSNRITGSTLSINTWYHIAVCRASGSTRMFINGTQTGSTYTDANNYGTTAPLGIATYWVSGSPATASTLNGYIDDLRVTKGYARYTSNFTAPTSAFLVY